MVPRLKTYLWVSAYLRRCGVEAVPAFVTHKGEADAGAVLVKINLLDGRARLVAAHFGDGGERVWADVVGDGPSAEEIVDRHIARALGRDPDLWVIEVEDRSGATRLEGF